MKLISSSRKEEPRSCDRGVFAVRRKGLRPRAATASLDLDPKDDVRALSRSQGADARRVVGFALALGGAVLFSAKAITAKLTYRHGIDAVTVLALRMLFAMPFFAVVGWLQLQATRRGSISALTWRERGQIMVLGLLGYYLSSFLDFLGLQYVNAGLERLILFLSPTMVLLLSSLWLKRPIARRQWLALGLSYLGVVLVFIQDVSLQGAAVLLGSAYVFASAASYAVYLISSGELIQRVGATRLVAYAMLTSCLACLVQYSVIHPWPTLFVLAAPVYGLSIVHAIFSTVLPVFMIMWAVDRIGAPLASQLGMIGPVSLLFLAWWLLDEPITLWQLAGTALCLVGIFVLSGLSRR